MRTAVWAVFLCTALAADVVVLKDTGEKVGGRVTDKGGHVEVQTEQGLRTFLKDEIERIVTNPAEFLGDADAQFEQAKQDFQKIAAAGGDQNALVREAVGKLTKAREAYAGARELFTEDKHSNLDQKLVQVMQLMRLLRERMGSEIARSSSSARPAPPPAPSVEQVVASVFDPAKRSDPAVRKAARDAFLAQRASGAYDLSTAAALYFSRTDAEWRLTGAALAAAQEYFGKPWLRDALKLDAAKHQEAVGWLADRIAAVRKADAAASVDALLLFAAGHLGQLPMGPEAEKLAKALGFLVANGVAGTAEGLAVRDLAGWLRTGEFALAHQAFVSEHRHKTDTPAVRFVWSVALLQLVLERKKGYDRPVGAFAGLRAPEAAVNDHVAALVKSIRAVTPCPMCAGDGWLRCTNCHGQKTIYFICKVCSGARVRKNSAGSEILCIPCRGTGLEKKLECGKCNHGFFDCPKCKLPDCKPCGSSARTPCATCKGHKVLKPPCGPCQGTGLDRMGGGGGRGYLCLTCKGAGHLPVQKCAACPNGFIDCGSCEPMRKPPVLEDIADARDCGLCEGRGTPFRGVALTCRSCYGLGRKLAPKADPAKVLAD
jgi:hypothetical protein